MKRAPQEPAQIFPGEYKQITDHCRWSDSSLFNHAMKVGPGQKTYICSRLFQR